MPLGIFNEINIWNQRLNIVAANTTTLVQVQGNNNVLEYHRFDQILVTNTDVIAHHLRLWWQSGGVNYLFGSALIPAGQGTVGTPPIDLVPLLFAGGNQGFMADNSGAIMVSVEETVTSGAVCCIFLGGTL